jgi:hypothetical protein
VTHQEVHDREIAEAYVRGRLSQQEREAFEDHCYSCDECFELVQDVDRFVTGIRDAADHGLLPSPKPGAPGWYRPAFYFAAAACLILASLAGWSLFIDRQRLLGDLAQQRAEIESRAQRLESQLTARATLPPNLQLIMLEATRAESAAAITRSPTIAHFAVWVEPPPAPPSTTYRLSILTGGGQAVETIEGLTRNSYGAIAANVPATRLTPGSYRAQLHSSASSGLVGEYRFIIRAKQ